MKTLVSYFWLFFREPGQFASEWIAGSSSMRDILLPVALLPIVQVILFNGLYLYFAPKKKTVLGVVRVLLKSLLFFLVSSGYFAVFALVAGKNLMESLIFCFVITGVNVVIVFLFFLLLIALSVLGQGLARSSLVFPFRSNANSVREDSVFRGYPLGLIQGTILLSGVFIIFKNQIIAMSVFFDFSWVWIVLGSSLYGIGYGVFHLAMSLFSSRGSQ